MILYFRERGVYSSFWVGGGEGGGIDREGEMHGSAWGHILSHMASKYYLSSVALYI